MIEAHLSQVRFIADRLAAKLPRYVDRDDLIGAGVIGLIDAANKFDAKRGVKFRTYAERRIRGAMLDSLRSMDWVPRSLRRRAREVQSAYAAIERESGRLASAEDVAEILGLSIGEFHLLLSHLNSLTVTGVPVIDEDASSGRPRQIPERGRETPYSLCERNELRERLAMAIDRLPYRERQVVALYFTEELTMKEIGEVLGVTESRISQIRSEAILHLRASLSRAGYAKAG